jgi:predicted CoA-binding protein
MTMHALINMPRVTVALVGASTSPHKYGNRIFKNLTAKGLSVLPVNPGTPVVEGVQSFATLSDLPVRPDIVDVVIPPHLGVSIVEQVAELGWDNVWFQPGAESKEASDKAAELGITVLDDGSCTMVSARQR